MPCSRKLHIATPATAVALSPEPLLLVIVVVTGTVTVVDVWRANVRTRLEVRRLIIYAATAAAAFALKYVGKSRVETLLSLRAAITIAASTTVRCDLRVLLCHVS